MDYSLLSSIELEKIYFECKLDDRAPAIWEKISDSSKRDISSKSFLVDLITEYDRQGLI